MCAARRLMSLIPLVRASGFEGLGRDLLGVLEERRFERRSAQPVGWLNTDTGVKPVHLSKREEGQELTGGYV